VLLLLLFRCLEILWIPIIFKSFLPVPAAPTDVLIVQKALATLIDDAWSSIRCYFWRSLKIHNLVVKLLLLLHKIVNLKKVRQFPFYFAIEILFSRWTLQPNVAVWQISSSLRLRWWVSCPSWCAYIWLRLMSCDWLAFQICLCDGTSLFYVAYRLALYYWLVVRMFWNLFHIFRLLNNYNLINWL